MNCDTIHRRLLSLERPDQPPADLRVHLASCAACRGWHKRLVETEARAARLPVPPAERKVAFLEQLRQPAPATLRFKPRPSGPVPSPKDRSRLKIAVAVAGAAALLLIAVGIATWPRGQTTPAGPGTTPSLLTQRLKDNARWAGAKTPEQRLEVLSDLADEVHSKAQKLAQGELKDLNREAALYREIVQRITSTEAREIDTKERVKVLKPLQARLAKAESLARQLAEAPDVRNTAAAEPLRQIAAAAGEGDQQIRALIQQAAA